MNRPNKRVRTQAVVLLRFGADIQTLVGAAYATGHCDGVNPCTKAYLLAHGAVSSVLGKDHDTYWADPFVLLEAAAQLEGSEPSRGQREQVVELLRCAADELLCGRYADEGFKPHTVEIQDFATSAWVHEVCRDEWDGCETTHEEAAMRMLSAAARVEEGQWP